MSNPRTSILRRVLGAVTVPVALLGLLASPAAVAPAAASPAHRSGWDGTPPLRVMPLGDSITFGVGSATYDSYRTDLHRRLTEAGVDVDFVGSLHNGTGPDTDHEGHKGWTIQRLAVHLNGWLRTYRPDVILLHIGTNDLARNIPGAAGRLNRLLDQIASARPGAEVFVAQVVGLADYAGVAEQVERTAAYNRSISTVVRSKGGRFHLVDQGGIHGVDMFNLLHPNDAGYRQISWNWYRALEPVLNHGGAAWPATGNPYRARTSLRCIDASILDPAVRGCHHWYQRSTVGGPAWMLPVSERVRYRVKVNGKLVTRVRVVHRWVTSA